jgi:hypothetical protein
VIVHPTWGLLVVEVKGGRKISYRGGKWSSTSHDGRENAIKDPGVQASRVAHHLGAFLNADPAFQRNAWRVRFAWCVCFPGHDLPSSAPLPPSLPRQLILTRADLRSLESSLERVFRSQAPTGCEVLDKAFVRAIHQRLLPSLDLVRPLSAVLSRQQETLVRLTAEQSQALHALEGISRLRISGPAGSGKTMLAMEKARRLAAAGARVALLCFNERLARFLRENAQGITVRNFHGLVSDYVKSAGMPDLQPPSDPERLRQFWDVDAVELLLEALEQSPDARFDAVVVDEGQDFRADWWVAIEELLYEPNRGTLYVFYDDRQNLFDGGPPQHLPPFALRRNCRNTKQIARFVGRCIDEDIPVWDEAPEGAEVEVFECGSADAARRRVAGILTSLVSEQGLGTEQIVILSTRNRARSWLSDAGQLGGFSLVDLDAKPAEQQVRFDSLHRFKGLADCVILSDVAHRHDQAEALQVYVGASRARHLLYVLRSSTRS